MEEEDELFYEACEFVIEHGGAPLHSYKEDLKLAIIVQQDLLI